MYRSWNDGKGLLGLFGRPCLPDYPCPDGRTSNGWQFYRPFEELPCNITQEVDEGGHAQKVLHYAHHSDRLDDLDPPLWRTAVYLWNYCGSHWDLAWEHVYRFSRGDCSVLGCSFWGPAFEIFGTDPYPEISELGYSKSLFIYDGVRSELRPEDGADYMVPEDLAPRVPWVTLHLDENRGFGVGNTVNPNDAPEITGQLALTMDEDFSLDLSVESLVIADPDIDPRYQVDFILRAEPGANYTLDGLTIEPDPDFFGSISVPVTVSDGAADSDVFQLEIDVLPVNDPPVITGQSALTAFLGVPLEITLEDLVVSDPDTPGGEPDDDRGGWRRLHANRQRHHAGLRVRIDNGGCNCERWQRRRHLESDRPSHHRRYGRRSPGRHSGDRRRRNRSARRRYRSRRHLGWR